MGLELFILYKDHIYKMGCGTIKKGPAVPTETESEEINEKIIPIAIVRRQVKEFGRRKKNQDELDRQL